MAMPIAIEIIGAGLPQKLNKLLSPKGDSFGET